MRIAFYATLKAPDHGVPSGDRRMARSLMAALEYGGHEVEIASRLRAWARGPEDQEAIRDAGLAEASRLAAGWSERLNQAPELWFTYHLYYRAPDWIGPHVSKSLGIPYVVAEASFAMKRAGGAWSMGHNATAEALRQADIVYALTKGDIPGLAKVDNFSADIISLPPFLDQSISAESPILASPNSIDRPVLLTVGMMRARAKLESYRFLAKALGRLADRDWTLLVAGDGPVRSEVAAAFEDFAPGKIRFLGTTGPEKTARLYQMADIFVWPGIDEAYGMVYLEAQAAGVPVVALDEGGVANVVVDGVSGRLIDARDAGRYGAAIGALLDDPGERRKLGTRAMNFVTRKRSLPGASAIIESSLLRLTPPTLRT